MKTSDLQQNFYEGTNQFREYYQSAVLGGRGVTQQNKFSTVPLNNFNGSVPGSEPQTSRKSTAHLELYHNGLKKIQQNKVQAELKKQKDDQYIAETCSFKPTLIAKKTFKRDERSEERPRDFDKFYKDMMRPINSVATKREVKKQIDSEAVKKEKEEF